MLAYFAEVRCGTSTPVIAPSHATIISYERGSLLAMSIFLKWTLHGVPHHANLVNYQPNVSTTQDTINALSTTSKHWICSRTFGNKKKNCMRKVP